MLIEIVKPRDDFLQHLRIRDNEHGTIHVSSESCLHLFAVLTVWNFYQLTLIVKIRELAVLHFLHRRKSVFRDNAENITSVLILELAPTHSLSDLRLRKDQIGSIASHIGKFFIFKFLFIKGAYKHQISELFNDRQRIGDTASPYISPYFIYLILNDTGNHCKPPTTSHNARYYSLYYSTICTNSQEFYVMFYGNNHLITFA